MSNILVGTGRTLLTNPVAAFAPTSIAGLNLWLKADAGLFQDSAGTTPAVADADPVGRWADQSGQGNHAIQVTGTKRPLLKQALYNGLPAIRMDGVDDFLAWTQIPLSTFTLYIVVKITSVTDYDGPFGNAGAGAVGFQFVRKDASTTVFTPHLTVYSAGAETANKDSSLTSPKPFTVPELHYWDSNFQHFKNTVAGVVSNGSGGYNRNTGIGNAGDTSSAGDHTGGDYLEMCLFNSAHNNATRLQMETYLKRWGLY